MRTHNATQAVHQELAASQTQPPRSAGRNQYSSTPVLRTTTCVTDGATVTAAPAAIMVQQVAHSAGAAMQGAHYDATGGLASQPASSETSQKYRKRKTVGKYETRSIKAAHPADTTTRSAHQVATDSRATQPVSSEANQTGRKRKSEAQAETRTIKVHGSPLPPLLAAPLPPL